MLTPPVFSKIERKKNRFIAKLRRNNGRINMNRILTDAPFRARHFGGTSVSIRQKLASWGPYLWFFRPLKTHFRGFYTSQTLSSLWSNRHENSFGVWKNHEYGPQLASFCRIETLVPSKWQARQGGSEKISFYVDLTIISPQFCSKSFFFEPIHSTYIGLYRS